MTLPNATADVLREAYAGGQDGQLPPLPSFMGAGGARIALHTELSPSLLSAEDIFRHCRQVDSRKFCGGNTTDPRSILVLLGDQCIKHCSSGKELKTKI